MKYANDYKLISYNSYCYLLSIVNNNKNIEKFNVMYNINSNNNIIVNYDNRINIELGNDSDIDYKITTAKEIILKKLSKTDVGRLDVKNIKSENRSYFYQNL